jgi:AraC family transcriptional regulator of adaptative response / DNA-3-methyladenine glycosylase II
MNVTEPRYAAEDHDAESVLLRISCRQPYAWRALLDFLAPRAIRGVEEVEEAEKAEEVEKGQDAVYRRVVSLDAEGNVHCGWVAVSYNSGNSLLNARICLPLTPVLGQIVARLKRLFDTDSCPEDMAEKLGVMANACPGLRVPGCFDAFEMGVRAVLGQQITVKAAHTLMARLVETLGSEVATPFPTLCRAFPTPRKVLETDGDTLGRMGIVRTRQRALWALAEAALSGELEPKADIEGQIRDLQKLPGIGEWTAQYLAMRALSWPDAFPHTDYAVKAAMGNIPPRAILEAAERWRPWRAYATMYLWRHGK